jgi:hypothetical protein
VVEDLLSDAYQQWRDALTKCEQFFGGVENRLHTIEVLERGRKTFDTAGDGLLVACHRGAYSGELGRFDNIYRGL